MSGATNKYGVWFSDGNTGFDFNWLGAKVSFKLLGQTIIGEVQQADTCYKTVDVEFQDGRKIVTVHAHIKAFNIV